MPQLRPKYISFDRYGTLLLFQTETVVREPYAANLDQSR
jgi:hypothetical protein